MAVVKVKEEVGLHNPTFSLYRRTVSLMDAGRERKFPHPRFAPHLCRMAGHVPRGRRSAQGVLQSR